MTQKQQSFRKEPKGKKKIRLRYEIKGETKHLTDTSALICEHLLNFTNVTDTSNLIHLNWWIKRALLAK